MIIDNNERIFKLLSDFFAEDFQWISIPFKISADAIQKFRLDDLQNMVIRYFYITAKGEISYTCDLIEIHKDAKDYTSTPPVEITNTILGGGFMETPFFFRRKMSDNLDIVITDLSSAVNEGKIEIFATNG